MRVLIVFNPISGAGRGAARAATLARQLQQAGHEASALATRLDSPRQWLDPALEAVEALVVAGGDGAMRLAAPSAIRARVPVYHFPCGTENLFAREFGMDGNAATLLRALKKNEIRTVDAGVANGRTFLLMASIGFDANVVHDLAARRGASISHLSYLPPIVRQLARWKPAEMKLEIDGAIVHLAGPGFVVVVNCRQYGWGLNPGGHARMDDGLLDVVFYPARSRAALLTWALRSRAQKHLQDPRLIYQRGKNVRITCAEPQHYQLDGDPPGVVHELEQAADEGVKVRVVSLEVAAGALRVLVP